MISYSKKLDGSRIEIYQKSIEFVKRINGNIINKREPSFLEVDNYLTISGKIKYPLSIQIEQRGEQSLVTLNLIQLGSFPRFLFQQYNNLPNYFLIYDYFNQIGYDLDKTELENFFLHEK